MIYLDFNYHSFILLILLFVICFSFIFLSSLLLLVRLNKLRAKGIYPKAGNETDGDVVRLIELGETALAIKCYRSIHKASLREAKEKLKLTLR